MQMMRSSRPVLRGVPELSRGVPGIILGSSPPRYDLELENFEAGDPSPNPPFRV